jgi:hypothetical protein
VGDALDLLLAGIVLSLLFVATYSQRSTWIALGSAALSVALVAGLVFLSTAQDSMPVQDGLARLAKMLPAGWDRRALDAAAALERASTSMASARKRTAGRNLEPMLATSASSLSDWQSWLPAQPDAERKTAPKDEPGPELAASSPDAAIKWFLDAPTSSASEVFAVHGANVSDQPLNVVRAVLKPDSGAQKLNLTLNVEGRGGAGDAAVPPGARFSLKAEGLTARKAGQLGGAILSVAYVQAGRRKSAIMYLTQATLAAGN